MPNQFKSATKEAAIANDLNKAATPYKDVLVATNTLASTVPLGEAGLAAEMAPAANAVVKETESVTLFRGVNESSPAFEDACNGIIKPRGGNVSPEAHNAGNTNSNFTSWSTDPEVATNFALRPNGEGVVLQVTVPKTTTVPSPSLKKVNLIQSPSTVVNESEVLLKVLLANCSIFPIKQ